MNTLRKLVSSPSQGIKPRPEAQLQALGNEPGCADCGQQRTAANRRDFCAHPDSVRVVLATDRHVPEYAQPRPARATSGGLLVFAGPGIIRRARLHQDGYSHCVLSHWWSIELVMGTGHTAGDTGGCPRSAFRYRLANSCWNVSSSNSWRCSRKKTNSFALRIFFTIRSSYLLNSTGGFQIAGYMLFLLLSFLFDVPHNRTIQYNKLS